MTAIDVEGLEPEIEHRLRSCRPGRARRARPTCSIGRLRQDAVAEIEDVRPAAHRRRGCASTPAVQGLAAGDQRQRIEIALRGEPGRQGGAHAARDRGSSRARAHRRCRLVREAREDARRRRARRRSPGPAGAPPSGPSTIRRIGSSDSARTAPAAGRPRSSRRSAPPRRPHRPGGSDRRSRPSTSRSISAAMKAGSR